MRRNIKHYRGADKPPGPTMSPPPYNRISSTRLNLQPTAPNKQEVGGSLTSINALALSPGERGSFLVQGSATSAAFIDPRTKQPVLIPPGGRSIPKLKIEDLTTSLAPLVESQLLPEKSPMNITDKRMNAAMRAIAIKKDLLESFEDAIRSPDMSLVNSKVSLLRRNSFGPATNIPTPRIGGGIGSNTSTAKSAALGSKTHVSPRKVGKVEEHNVKKLMGQLRDKYLDEMESQLGIAVDRKSLGVLSGTNKGQGGDEPHLSGTLSRPSINATEMTSRIDKVVREWSYEAQQLSKNAKSPPTKTILNPKQTANPKLSHSPRSVGGKNEELSVVPAAANNIPLEKTAKNKNLAKISTAFGRTLDKYSGKKDVRELINIPEDDVEKLEAEHEARRKAHEAVFKNAVTLDLSEDPIVEVEENDTNNNIPPSLNRKNEVKALEHGEQHQSYKGQPEMKGSRAGVKKTGIEERKKNARPNFMESIKLAKDDENEVYTIIKDHMEYEMASGPPKLSQRKSNTTIRRPAKTPSRSDPVGKVLMKYDSHKKLQNLVDSFSKKIDNSEDSHVVSKGGT